MPSINQIADQSSQTAQAEPIGARKKLGPISTILTDLRDAAPADRFSLDWLLGRLKSRSFAILILMLSLIAMAPGVSIIAGLLMMISAGQMIVGRSTPAFPRRLGAYTLPSAYLSASVRRVVPMIGYVEQIIRPRWPLPHETTKRTVGFVVALLAIAVVFCPIPLSNVAPAFMIALISIAYLAEDGLFLFFTLLVSLILLAIAIIVVWQAIVGVEKISGFFF